MRTEPGSFIDLETRRAPDPDEGERAGFRPAVFAYFKSKGLPPPNLRGSEWAKALPRGARFRDKQKVRQLYGIEWCNDARDLNLSKSWYLIELCTVALHAGSMLVIPLVVIYYAFHMQHIWALLMCPPDGIHGTWPALWYDLFNSYLVWSPSFDTVEPGEADQSRHTLLLVRMICVEAVAFMVLAILRLTLHYLSFPPSRAVRIFKSAFGVVLGLHILWVFSYIGVISAWLILAAILQPTKFLPFGMAVLVVGVVAVTTYSTMTGAAAKLKEKVEEAVNKLLQVTGCHCCRHHHLLCCLTSTSPPPFPPLCR